MQRWLLETAYRALENGTLPLRRQSGVIGLTRVIAGISMSDVYGSSTAVYTGSFSMDYMLQLCRDPENAPKYTALGLGLSMLANRLSWFYNLRGPSIGLDTACSSSAAGIDLAFQALRNRSCDMASHLLSPRGTV
jgi:acyl transferase domain-containing protein